MSSQHSSSFDINHVFEERMQQLGRKATAQEPQELALPRCISAAECVKPVSCVKHRVQRHGFGEGRLPIPDILIRDKEEANDASRRHQHEQQQRRQEPAAGPAHKTHAGKLLRPSQQQAQQQLDAIKARRSAAQAFSAAVDRRNAERLQQQQPVSSSKPDSHSSGSKSRRHSSSGSSGTPAAAAAAVLLLAAGQEGRTRPATAPQQVHPVAASAAAVVPHQQPLVQRHLPRRSSDGLSTQPSLAATAAAAAAVAVPDMAAAESAHADDATSPAAPADAVGCWPETAVCVPAQRHSSSVVTTRTFLTEATSQPPSPVRPRAPNTAGGLGCCDAAGSFNSINSGAACSAGAGAAPVFAAVLPDEGKGSEAAAGTVELEVVAVCETGPQGCAVAGSVSSNAELQQQAISSSDAASNRLLRYAAAHSPLPVAPPANSAPQGDNTQRSGFSMPSGNGSNVSSNSAIFPSKFNTGQPGNVRAAVCSPVQQRSGSPNNMRQGSGPHWSPVPPRTQLQPPVVVRPMADWVLDEEPMHEPPPLQMPLQQQQSPAAAAAAAACQGRPPWQGSKGAGGGGPPQAEASQGGGMAGRGIGNISSSSRRVSVSSISLRGGGGAARASQASGGGSSGAGFTNGKLAQVVASVSDKVAKRHLVLPALCSCGHGTSVLDARYPQRCCSNCPLRGNADAYEQLLAGLLSGMGLD